ncbi:MAG: hypothetical protein ACI8WB_006146 [Phenylobacterium sp.]|jgi:hypothetical protein
MNLRISNLSTQKKLNIIATDSVNPFNNTAIDTTTDIMLSLVPNSQMIQGTLSLKTTAIESEDNQILLTTDKCGENVIVTTVAQLNVVVIPLHQNIAIEWDGQITHISGY